MVLVVVPGTQVHRITLAAVLGQAEDVDEEPQAFVEFGCQQLDVPKVRDLVQGRPRGRRVLRTRHGHLRGNTVPSKSLRAVRTTPDRITVGGPLLRFSSISTWTCPVGCSMSNRVWPGVSAARSAPAAPSSVTAVATLAAPSTPIESWTRTGMKVRVHIVPPSAGAATSETFG